MSQENGSNAAVSTERVFAASPREIFAAFEQPDRLARWWGPAGFTNTFEQFEFRPGGRWVFVMHGPNGSSYPNESVFREIQPDARIVIEHVVKPWYRLTVTLSAHGDETHLAWGPGVRESRARREDAPPQRDRQRAEPRPAAVVALA